MIDWEEVLKKLKFEAENVRIDTIEEMNRLRDMIMLMAPNEQEGGNKQNLEDMAILVSEMEEMEARIWSLEESIDSVRGQIKVVGRWFGLEEKFDNCHKIGGKDCPHEECYFNHEGLCSYPYMDPPPEGDYEGVEE